MYTELGQIVNPKHTALVVWDVQNALVSSAFNKDEFLRNIKTILHIARDTNIPIIYTKIVPLAPAYESPWRTLMQMKRHGVDQSEKLPPFMVPGSWEAEIYPDVYPHKADLIIDKNTTSIFIGTNFENIMRNMGISTLLFTGISTEVGIDSSARDSSNRGFYTIVVSDCVSTSIKEMHDAALLTLQRVCMVIPSGEINNCWNK